MSEYWGYHLVLNCADCDTNAIDDHDNIRNFVKQLIEDIDMVAYGEPRIVKFGSGNKAGYTLDQLIETSNIMGHFVPDNGAGRSDAYLDVFSCKTFDKKVVRKLVKKYFKAKRIRTKYMIRQA